MPYSGPLLRLFPGPSSSLSKVPKVGQDYKLCASAVLQDFACQTSIVTNGLPYYPALIVPVLSPVIASNPGKKLGR